MLDAHSQVSMSSDDLTCVQCVEYCIFDYRTVMQAILFPSNSNNLLDRTWDLLCACAICSAQS